MAVQDERALSLQLERRLGPAMLTPPPGQGEMIAAGMLPSPAAGVAGQLARVFLHRWPCHPAGPSRPAADAGHLGL
jgi:hypothetical protein